MSNGSAQSAGVVMSDLRRIWGLLSLSPWRIAVAIGWGVLALGSGLGLAALAAWLIARAWEMPPVLDLSVAVVAVRTLGISRGLCRYLERLATHDVALRAMTTARTTVYRTLARSDVWMRRPMRGGDSHGQTATALDPGAGPTAAGGAAQLRRGDLLVRIGSDIDDLGAVVVRAFVPIAVAIVLALAAVGLLATISVAAATILAVSLAISGIIAPWLSSRAAQEAERAVRADRAEFTAQALTVLDHAAELRVAGRLDAALAVADKAGQRAVAAEDSAAARSAWAAAATPLSIGASVLGALLVGIAIYGPNGGPAAMTPMALTVLVLLPLSAFEAVGALPAAAQALTTARAALHRLSLVKGAGDVLGAPDGLAHQSSDGVSVEGGANVGHRHSAGRHMVAHQSLDHLSGVDANSRYRKTRDDSSRDLLSGNLSEDSEEGASSVDRSLRDLLPSNLPDRPEGRRIAVVGPSGAGKTTLLMAWAGLFDTPRPGVTFFAEDAHLFGTTVFENLRVARGDLSADEAEKALRTVGLGDWLDSLPDGVHTGLVGGAAAVSGGQRRRILLARALISPARVLLLDEPTEHLEAEAGARLLRDLLDIDSGLVESDRTVVLVTHQLPPDHCADVIVHVLASGLVTTDFLDSANGTEPTDSANREIPLPTR